MKIAIIKYNAGNIRSVSFALDRLGVEHIITADPDEIRNADKVIFPGVGEASSTMKYLKDTKLDELIVSLKQPVLGICLGMQLMCSHSEEGDVPCLGIFEETVNKFELPQPNTDLIKVPHMGWNAITNVNSALFDASLEGKYVYFVHSYYVALGEHTAATTNYILPYSSALHKNNFYATQFHPEKSGDVGSKILENFIKL
ncbi:imidazole glycerol phosphate synthase subunit HisH [Labilibacter marinus]|uniref:imidazole glycerol phosphate synthase subunit HisH n=1 Tax=Labilibacter marinus TaxID=1477105 RepID=UPI00082D410F|nr:imidazole glycerol phosphate synthase subunit HisH [Labilibacter marinus]